TSHRVELNNRRAVVTTEANEAVTEAVKTIKDLGYGVTTVKNTIPVLGMSCASCASSTQSTVIHTPGVVDASVNFATGNLTVEYITDMTDANKLKAAVQGIGFDLLLE